MDYADHIKNLLMYLFLGFFQGFSEPLPISSSGHLVLLRNIFHIYIPGLSFEIFVHCGSLIAIVTMYRKDIFRIIQKGRDYVIKGDQRGENDFYFIILLFIASLPAAVIGLFLETYINQLLTNTFIVGITLLITGSFLWIIRHLRGTKEDEQMSFKDALIIGFAQAFALLPGISRSGATIVAAMLLGMKRKTALRFSFLLFIPVSLGATLLSIRDIINDPYIHIRIIPYLLAFIATIFATYYSLKWFIGVMERGKLKYFAYYCWGIGGFILLFYI